MQTMNEQTLKKATGRSKSEWYGIIRSGGKAEASHKEIADFLHEAHGVSRWWAQEITVEYEKHIGRRVLGQTQDGSFQIGVSRTISASADRVWNLLESAEGIGLITSDPGGDRPSVPAEPGQEFFEALASLEGQSAAGISIETTTFEPGSHVRMRWQRPRWQAHSILQIRVTAKSESKTTLSFHQEKLPSWSDREELQRHWRRVAEEMAELIAAEDSGGG
jgi:uncharacterized protein YndB with AHSA1/START domain